VDKRSRSSIPPNAKEYVVTAYRREGSPSDRGGCTITLRKTECRYRGKVVGLRFYEEDSTLVREVPLKGIGRTVSYMTGTIPAHCLVLSRISRGCNTVSRDSGWRTAG
jgi:hypothetical protein